LLPGRVGAEDLQEQGPLPDLAQRRGNLRRIAMPLDVHEDDVLPGALLGRARLDLREVDPEPGQRLEDPIERAGLVALREQDRRIVARRRTTRVAAHAAEAGRV